MGLGGQGADADAAGARADHAARHRVCQEAAQGGLAGTLTPSCDAPPSKHCTAKRSSLLHNSC